MRIQTTAILVCVVGCYRGPAASPPQRQVERAHDPGALVMSAPNEPANHAGVWVGGCNTGCENCSLASYKSYVVGTLDRTGAQLFPSPDPPQPGYSCGATVAIGDRVTLHAHTTEGLEIAAWKPFFNTDACPCTKPTNVCTFVVTPEIAASHPRIYCGAIWRQAAAAQIGR